MLERREGNRQGVLEMFLAYPVSDVWQGIFVRTTLICVSCIADRSVGITVSFEDSSFLGAIRRVIDVGVKGWSRHGESGELVSLRRAS